MGILDLINFVVAWVFDVFRLYSAGLHGNCLHAAMVIGHGGYTVGANYIGVHQIACVLHVPAWCVCMCARAHLKLIMDCGRDLNLMQVSMTTVD